jgi:hypothetical protein
VVRPRLSTTARLRNCAVAPDQPTKRLRAVPGTPSAPPGRASRTSSTRAPTARCVARPARRGAVPAGVRPGSARAERGGRRAGSHRSGTSSALVSQPATPNSATTAASSTRLLTAPAPAEPERRGRSRRGRGSADATPDGGARRPPAEAEPAQPTPPTLGGPPAPRLPDVRPAAGAAAGTIPACAIRLRSYMPISSESGARKPRSTFNSTRNVTFSSPRSIPPT